MNPTQTRSRTVCALALVIQSSAAVAIPGHIEGWGYNFFGQAAPPPGLEDVIAIAAGIDHSVALRANGTVVAWGANYSGQIMVPAGLSNVVAIATATHTLALKNDGTIVAWGDTWPAVTNVPAGLAAVKAIAAASGGGNAYSLALRSNGTVVAWGINTLGTNLPAGLNGIVGIAAGNNHGVAIRNDGTVVAWGDNFFGQATPPPGLSGVVAVRAGQTSSLAIKSDGTVVVWGSFAPVPAGLNDVLDVRFGNAHALALQSNGVAVAWGENHVGQGVVPFGGNGITAVAAGGNHNLLLTARPRITFMSPPVNVSQGDTVTFSVGATGGPLSYQWQRNGAHLPDRTNSSLTLPNVQASDAGVYTVFVTNPYGTAQSPATSLSFAPPEIFAQPQSITRYQGQSAWFDVSARGLAPLTYQWRKGGTNLNGQTSAILTMTNVRTTDAGSYQVVVTDSAGKSATSVVATLTVIDPAITSVTLRPVLDTSIFSSGGNPQGVLSILAGTRNNGIRDRGLLRFDLSSVPPGARIDSARLRLVVTRVPISPPTSTFLLHRMLRPWGSDATWTQASTGVPWAAPGGQQSNDYSATITASRAVALTGAHEFGPSVEMVADVRRWLADPGANHGWLLKTENETVLRSARHFGSSESAQPPQLFLRFTHGALLTNARVEGTNFTFGFDTADGLASRVECRDNLEAGEWTTLTNFPAGPAAPVSVSVPITTARRFYRVVFE